MYRKNVITTIYRVIYVISDICIMYTSYFCIHTYILHISLSVCHAYVGTVDFVVSELAALNPYMVIPVHESSAASGSAWLRGAVLFPGGLLSPTALKQTLRKLHFLAGVPKLKAWA